MATVEPFNTGLTEAQLTTAFQRALNDYTNAQIDAAIASAVAGKQNTLTFDTTPTASSTNPVTSGGVYDALALQQGREVRSTSHYSLQKIRPEILQLYQAPRFQPKKLHTRYHAQMW